MSAKGKHADKPAEEVKQDQTPAGDKSVIRARRAMQMKQMLPNADWINTQIVAGGKGTKKLIGRIFGVVTGISEKENTLPNGEKSQSILLNGMFESESYVTGEVSEATGVYFPMAFAEKIKAMFAADADLKTVEVDTDIGLEATGKSIPYEWVVLQYVDGNAMNPLKRLRGSRGRPELAAAPVAALEAPKG